MSAAPNLAAVEDAATTTAPPPDTERAEVAAIGPSLTNDGAPPHGDDDAPNGSETERGAKLRVAANAYMVSLIDWDTLLDGEPREAEWLVEPFIALGRSHSLTAPAKLGKSLLTLYVIGCLCIGRDAFTGDKRDPAKVLYVDHEMTEDDIRERLEDMGFTTSADRAALRENLYYALLPSSAPLDTTSGGAELCEVVEHLGVELVVIDTFSRVTSGDENDAGTTRDYYANTGQPLKRLGVATLRLDHMGKVKGKGTRGSSAKGDDVDVAWLLDDTDKGLKLTTPVRARMGWVPDTVNLAKTAEPLSWRVVENSWPAGTKPTADDLDAIGVPLTVGKGPARTALKAAGKPAPRNEVLLAAQRWRRSEDRRRADTGDDVSDLI